MIPFDPYFASTPKPTPPKVNYTATWHRFRALTHLQQAEAISSIQRSTNPSLIDQAILRRWDKLNSSNLPTA